MRQPMLFGPSTPSLSGLEDGALTWLILALRSTRATRATRPGAPVEQDAEWHRFMRILADRRDRRFALPSENIGQARDNAARFHTCYQFPGTPDFWDASPKTYKTSSHA